MPTPTKSAAPKQRSTPKKRQKRSAQAYDAAAIETLEGMEAVRKRPAMYIGGTGTNGLMHLVWETIDNAVDEASAGFATKVDVVVRRDGSVEVTDNGRGIPVGLHPEKGVSAVEVVFTELHAGGKFGDQSYGASGGLHGVGASVVNAMSTRVDVEVWRDGYSHSLSFHNQEAGHYHGSTFKAGHDLEKVKRAKATKPGTRVRFWPDRELFDEHAEIVVEQIRARLRDTCFLVPGMKVSVKDLSDSDSEPFTFVSRGGLKDLVTEHASRHKAVGSAISIKGSESFTERVPVNGKISEVTRHCEVEAALQWTTGYDTDVRSYVNIIPTSAGGTHLLGFEKSLTKVINNTVLKDLRKLAKLARAGNNQHKATGDDVQEGLVAAVKVSFSEPQFRGQTKQELGTPAVEGVVSRIAYAQLKAWFSPGGGPKHHVKAIGDKIATAILNRHAARQMLETKRKTAKLGSAALPAKLADCRVHGLQAELILVEGDSAAGPAKRGRDSEFMAILPLRGKIVNAAKSTTKQVLENVEAQAIITALGAGAGQTFDIESARYGRIVILCDADVDGSHIRCLLLTLIHRHMRPMLARGRVFAAMPPLYTARVGQKVLRAYTVEERDRLTARAARGNRKAENIKWQRFKGLGEMNTDELRFCALDPNSRTLKRMTMEDGEEAAKAAEMFDILMGNDVARRRDYIIANSSLVDASILDV